jgi:hypothetical protein
MNAKDVRALHRELRDFIADRNAMLLTGDVDEMIAFMRRWNIDTPRDRGVAELTCTRPAPPATKCHSTSAWPRNAGCSNAARRRWTKEMSR